MYRINIFVFFFFFSSRRRHTRFDCDWSSDVCSSDLLRLATQKDVVWKNRNHFLGVAAQVMRRILVEDRKSTRLNSSHSQISYAVFCLKKKKLTYKAVDLLKRNDSVASCTYSRVF